MIDFPLLEPLTSKQELIKLCIILIRTFAKFKEPRQVNVEFHIGKDKDADTKGSKFSVSISFFKENDNRTVDLYPFIELEINKTRVNKAIEAIKKNDLEAFGKIRDY